MNNTLSTKLHLDAPDEFYELLLQAHQDLTLTQSHALNVRLLLLLANHIGSTKVLRQALELARDALPVNL